MKVKRPDLNLLINSSFFFSRSKWRWTKEKKDRNDPKVRKRQKAANIELNLNRETNNESKTTSILIWRANLFFESIQHNRFALCNQQKVVAYSDCRTGSSERDLWRSGKTWVWWLSVTSHINLVLHRQSAASQPVDWGLRSHYRQRYIWKTPTVEYR